jgi:hypothetical protein
MDCTSCKENCPFVKSKLCASERECPNFMESWWQEGGTGQPKVISDCAPKRMLIQQQVEVNRMFALQQAVEQMRNRLETLEGLLGQLIQQSKEYVLQQAAPKQIPKKQKKGEIRHEPSNSS